MNSASTRILLVLCLYSASALAQSAPSEESEVRALVDRYVESRRTGNTEAIAALFTPDADQLVSTGEWRKGRSALVAGAAASSKRESGRSITVESVRLLTPDVALVDGRYETQLTGSDEVRRMWTTIVARRTGQGWRIEAIRNMFPAPLPSPKPK